MARQSELNRWKNVDVVSESESFVEVKLILAPHCGEIKLSFRELQQTLSCHNPRLSHSSLLVFSFLTFSFQSKTNTHTPTQTTSPPTNALAHSCTHTF